jgi:dTDP-glucose 4,6-dehydratase
VKLVVITGCLGLIGSHVTKRCLEEDWQVLGIDKCSYAANKSLIKEFEKNKNFSFIKKDIATLEYLPDCDYVINLAAESHVGNSIVDSGDFLHSNINGVKNLLDLIRNKQKNVFNQPVLLHFSTDEVYGDIIRGEHLETDNLNPSNPYSASKAAADMLINAWARTYDINYIIVRPTNNYGINQYPEKLIPISVKALQLGKKIKLHNKGEPIRNWLHAEDTAEAIITIIKSNKINEIYNISGNLEQKNKITVQKIINAYFDEEVPLENFVDLSHCREGQDVRYSLNDDKLKLLGWKPTKNFDKEIKTIVSFYKNNFRW